MRSGSSWTARPAAYVQPPGSKVCNPRATPWPKVLECPKWEIFLGEASRMSAQQAPPSVQSAYQTMRLIVVFGWAVYPIGYFLGYLTGNPADSSNALNIIYNLADVLNKIAFGVIIWSVAVRESEAVTAK